MKAKKKKKKRFTECCCTGEIGTCTDAWVHVWVCVCDKLLQSVFQYEVGLEFIQVTDKQEVLGSGCH